MSLFDVLKYGNTDVNSEYELRKLPIELINLYWDISYPRLSHLSYETKIRHLTTFSMDSGLTNIRTLLFKKALKAYDGTF